MQIKNAKTTILPCLIALLIVNPVHLGQFTFSISKKNSSLNILPYPKSKYLEETVFEDAGYTSSTVLSLSDGVGGWEFPSSFMARLLTLIFAKGAVEQVNTGPGLTDVHKDASFYYSELFNNVLRYQKILQSSLTSFIKSANIRSVMDRQIYWENLKQIKGNYENFEFNLGGAGTLLGAFITDAKTDRPKLNVAQCGDSLFMILRAFQVEKGIIYLPVVISDDMQKSFNAPSQIASTILTNVMNSDKANCKGDGSNDFTEFGLGSLLDFQVKKFQFEIQANDLLIMGSDGLFDNLSAALITLFVNKAIKNLSRHSVDTLNAKTFFNKIIDTFARKTISSQPTFYRNMVPKLKKVPLHIYEEKYTSEYDPRIICDARFQYNNRSNYRVIDEDEMLLEDFQPSSQVTTDDHYLNSIRDQHKNKISIDNQQKVYNYEQDSEYMKLINEAKSRQTTSSKDNTKGTLTKEEYKEQLKSQLKHRSFAKNIVDPSNVISYSKSPSKIQSTGYLMSKDNSRSISSNENNYETYLSNRISQSPHINTKNNYVTYNKEINPNSRKVDNFTRKSEIEKTRVESVNSNLNQRGNQQTIVVDESQYDEETLEFMKIEKEIEDRLKQETDSNNIKMNSSPTKKSNARSAFSEFKKAHQKERILAETGGSNQRNRATSNNTGANRNPRVSSQNNTGQRMNKVPPKPFVFDCDMTEYMAIPKPNGEQKYLSSINFSDCVLKNIKLFAFQPDILNNINYNFLTDALAYGTKYYTEHPDMKLSHFWVKAKQFNVSDHFGAKGDDITVITSGIIFDNTEKPRDTYNREIADIDRDIEIVFRDLAKGAKEYLKNTIIIPDYYDPTVPKK